MTHKTIFLLACVFVSLYSFSQKKQSFKLNQKYATNVVNSIFYAARSGSFDHLNGLCDPNGFSDRDVKRICSMTQLAHTINASAASDNARKNLEEFVSIFESGKITGDVVYEKKEGSEFANIPIWYEHPMGESRSNETMVLVKRAGKWYLYSL